MSRERVASAWWPKIIVAMLLLPLAAKAAENEPAISYQSRQLDGMPYRLLVPPRYESSNKYPLVLYLHGAGQAGTDNRNQIDNWADILRLFESEQSKSPAFLLAPQSPDRWVNWDWTKGSYDLAKVPESGSMKKAIAIVKAVIAEFSIDVDRVYVVGFSMGGFGAWDALVRYPELWAAGLPTEGGGAPASAERIKSIPVWALHVADDSAVPVSGSREMYAALVKAGGAPVYTEFARGGHGTAHRPTEQLVTWVYEQKRSRPATSPVALRTSISAGPPRTVSVSSSLPSTQIRFTTDGQVPSRSGGSPYTGAVVMPKLGAVQFAAFSSSGEDEQTMFAAVPVDGVMPFAGPADGGTLAPPGSDGAAETTTPEPVQRDGGVTRDAAAGRTPSEDLGGNRSGGDAGGARRDEPGVAMPRDAGAPGGEERGAPSSLRGGCSYAPGGREALPLTLVALSSLLCWGALRRVGGARPRVPPRGSWW